MSDAPRASRLGPHGGHRRSKATTAGQGDDNHDITLKARGTSRRYIVERLIRDQRFDLVEGIKSRQISAFSAAVEAGYVRRRKTGVVNDDHNLTRTRKHAMAEALDRPPPPYACAELPCFACRQPQAWRALAEISETYLRARRGQPSRASMNGVLPMSCCRRQRLASVETLIA
jgi:hypothetical protein